MAESKRQNSFFPEWKQQVFIHKRVKSDSVEKWGIDPHTSRMLSERSTIWATSPHDVLCHIIQFIRIKSDTTRELFTLIQRLVLPYHFGDPYNQKARI